MVGLFGAALLYGDSMITPVIFAFMSRNAERAAAYVHIPPDRVVQMGTQVEL